MKTTKTYSIEESLFAAFDLLATERNINKSSFIEDLIKKYLKDNDMEFVDRVYESKFNPGSVVNVLTQDSTYYILSDGSKIQKILFMQNFKEVEGVQPSEFFKKSDEYIAKNLVEQIKNIDVEKCVDSVIFHDTYKTTIKEEAHVSDIYKANDDEKELFIIDHNFKTNAYLKFSKTKICEIIVQLSKMKFKNDKDENHKELLIKVFTNYKDSMIS